MSDTKQPSAAPILDESLQDVVRMVARLSKDCFHGKLTLHYQAGKVSYITKEENIRPLDKQRH